MTRLFWSKVFSRKCRYKFYVLWCCGAVLISCNISSIFQFSISSTITRSHYLRADCSCCLLLCFIWLPVIQRSKSAIKRQTYFITTSCIFIPIDGTVELCYFERICWLTRSLHTDLEDNMKHLVVTSVTKYAPLIRWLEIGMWLVVVIVN